MIKLAGALGVLCLLAFIIYKLWRKYQSHTLQKMDERRGLFSRDDFVDYMVDNKGADRDLSQAVYDTVLRFLPYQAFTIYPLDNLHHVLGFTNNEVRDLLTDVCMHLDAKHPSLKDQEQYEDNHGELKTIEDVVVFLNWWKGKG